MALTLFKWRGRRRSTSASSTYILINGSMITSSSPNPAASYHIRPFRDARPGLLLLLLLLQCRADREDVSSLLVCFGPIRERWFVRLLNESPVIYVRSTCLRPTHFAMSRGSIYSIALSFPCHSHKSFGCYESCLIARQPPQSCRLFLQITKLFLCLLARPLQGLPFREGSLPPFARTWHPPR